MGQTSVFASRRSTSEGSLTLRKSRKSTKIVEKSLRRRCANEPRENKSIFSLLDATCCRFWSPRGAPRRSRAPFLASRGALGQSPDTPGAHRGRPKTLQRRHRDALGCHGASREAPGTGYESILGAPSRSRDRFCIEFRADLRIDLRTNFASELAIEWSVSVNFEVFSGWTLHEASGFVWKSLGRCSVIS